MNILNRIFNWLKKVSFYRTKAILFSTLVAGVMLDMFVKVDLDKLTFQYGNNSASVIVLIGLMLTCIVFVSFDVWYERIKIKERTRKEMWDALKDSEIPKSLKKEIIRLLMSKK